MGNWKNLSELKSNMLIIRGMNNLSIHPAWVKQFKPRKDKISLHAVPKHHFGLNSGYIDNISLNVRSIPLGLSSGSSSTLLNFTNSNVQAMIDKVINPFISEKAAGSLLNEKVDLALDRLKAIGKNYNIHSNQIHESLVQARELHLNYWKFYVLTLNIDTFIINRFGVGR